MSNALTLVRRLGKDEDGAALIEYTVLLGVLLVAVIAVIGSVGAWVGGQWSSLCKALPGATCWSRAACCFEPQWQSAAYYPGTSVFSPRLSQFCISANRNSIFYEFDRRVGALCVADRHRNRTAE
jgi:pilus assembly protein Flp/PilA